MDFAQLNHHDSLCLDAGLAQQTKYCVASLCCRVQVASFKKPSAH